MRARRVAHAERRFRSIQDLVRRGISVALRVRGATMSHTRLRPSADVRASISDDGLVLLDVRGGVVLASNDAGARIWRLLERGCSHLEIAQLLVDTYAIPSERASRDADSFIASLAARGLIVEDRSC